MYQIDKLCKCDRVYLFFQWLMCVVALITRTGSVLTNVWVGGCKRLKCVHGYVCYTVYVID